MKCSMTTMLKAWAGLATLVAVAYALLPGARTVIETLAPLLFLLLCPLVMLGMKSGLRSSPSQARCEPQGVHKSPQAMSESGQAPR